MYTFSPSSLKAFEDPTACPVKWRATWITKEISFEPSEVMQKGQYFEYLCIGGSAKEDDNVTSLPLLRNGNKSADQQRIEEQAALFKELFNPKSPHYLNYEIVRTQERIEGSNMKGVIDLVVRNIITDEFGVIDLKATTDIESTRPPFGWGDIKNTDKTQLPMYKILYKEKYGVTPFTEYLVFGFNSKKGAIHRTVEVSEPCIKHIEERVDQANYVYNLYEEKGWVTDASEKECSNCPFIDCTSRFIKQTIEGKAEKEEEVLIKKERIIL